MAKRATTKTLTAETLAGLPDWRGLEGHDALLARWRALAVADRLPPVMLLHGRAGLGKSHLLTALAALSTCDTHAACGACDGCTWLLTARHPDVFWTCGTAPRLSVEHAAEVQEHLSLTAACGVRIVVVQDVERFSAQAMNRLLKTLEEPPPGARILLSTSRLSAVLETVRSRAVKVAVPPPPASVTAGLLRAARPDLKDAEVAQLLKAGGLAPGRVLRLAGIGVSEDEEPVEGGNDAARAVQSWELGANERYWRRLKAGAGPFAGEELIETRRQRDVARRARMLAVRAKVALNPQLVADSLGMTR